MVHKVVFSILLGIHTIGSAWENMPQNQPKFSEDYPDDPNKRSEIAAPSDESPTGTLIPMKMSETKPITQIPVHPLVPPQRLPTHISGNRPIPSTECLFGENRCQLQCTARGFTKAVCRSHTCSCLKDGIKSDQSLGLCSTLCAKNCASLNGELKGICDAKDFCYCYDQKARVDIHRDKCYIPKTICQEQCVSNGFSMSSCVDEFCICADARSKYKSYNYKGGSCVVPKDYCRERCASAKFPKGVCYNDRCICTMLGNADKNFFVFDVGKDSAECDQCKIECRKMAAFGRCIGNECVCMNGEYYKVIGSNVDESRCNLPKDYCTFTCANNKYYKRAECVGFSCKCYIGKNEKVFDFEKGKCQFPRDECQNACESSAHKFQKGFCNGGDCLCMKPFVNKELPPLNNSAFLCEKYPRPPFTTMCLTH